MWSTAEKRQKVEFGGDEGRNLESHIFKGNVYVVAIGKAAWEKALSAHHALK